MKMFGLLCVAMSLSFSAMAYDLKGHWMHSTAKPDDQVINFIFINNMYRAYVKEEIINRNGSPSHTIEQSLRIFPVNENSLRGELDIFDSRGCSFKNYEVTVEFESADRANFLMTLPRYKIVTYTSGSTTSNYPRTSTGHSRSECVLVDTIEVPVQLIRVK